MVVGFEPRLHFTKLPEIHASKRSPLSHLSSFSPRSSSFLLQNSSPLSRDSLVETFLTKMSASPLSVGFAKATGITATSSNPSSSSIENTSAATSVQFPFKATKPINFSKFNLHHDLVKSSPFSLFSRSLFVCGSAGFDGFEATNTTEVLEKETGSEDEEEQQEEEKELEEEGEENYGDSVSLSGEARRLYVGNLPFSMTSSQLADIFSECGRVASVEIVYDRVTDRSRGFAFITMGSFEEAKEAIRLFDGSQVGGRTVKVNFPEVPRGGEREVMEPKIRSGYRAFVDSPHKLYAGNLYWGLTSEGLREVFQDQPGFLSAKVVYDRGTGRSRGFGFITFASAEDADSALDSLNGVELEGRPLRLNLALNRSSPSPTSAIGSDSES